MIFNIKKYNIKIKTTIRIKYQRITQQLKSSKTDIPVELEKNTLFFEIFKFGLLVLFKTFSKI